MIPAASAADANASTSASTAAVLLAPAGFRVTALLFTAALLVALGVRRPVAIAAFALASSFGLFHVFYHWLNVPLPVGPFGL